MGELSRSQSPKASSRRRLVGKETICGSPWRRPDADETRLAGTQKSTTTAKMNRLRGSRRGARIR